MSATRDTSNTKPPETAVAKRRRSATSALTQLPAMVQNFIWGQDAIAVREAKEIAEKIEDSHPAVHRKLVSILSRQMRSVSLPSVPTELVTVMHARYGFDAVTLPDNVLDQCQGIVAEHRRSDELAAFHLAPRHKVLLCGPPGNGKTMLAEALARELDVPFLAVSHGGLVDSYMGATGKNIDKLFDYARTAPCLVFIDEFDGISIKRSAGSDVGEIRRVTNHLLIAIEKLPPHVTLVCATNAESLLDEAIKRRFDLAIDLPQPTRALKLRCAKRELDPALTPGLDVSHLAETVADLGLENLFFVTERCRQIRRDLVLNQGRGIDALLNAVGFNSNASTPADGD